jgi:hypothetical protein
MAKQQSFADKLKKKTSEQQAKPIKVVFSYKAADTGVWRFGEKFVYVAPGTSEDSVIAQEIKNSRARLEKN